MLGSRYPTDSYVVVSLSTIEQPGTRRKCPSSVTAPFPTLASSCSSVLPSRPKNGDQRRIRKPAAARHCCPTPATSSIQHQMSDVQARYGAPFRAAYCTCVSSTSCGPGARAEAGNSHKDFTHKRQPLGTYGRSHEERCMRITRSTHTTQPTSSVKVRGTVYLSSC